MIAMRGKNFYLERDWSGVSGAFEEFKEMDCVTPRCIVNSIGVD
jgi:hypothetical protein